MFGILQNETVTPEQLYDDWRTLGVTSNDYDHKRFEQIFGTAYTSPEANAMDRFLSNMNIMVKQRPTGFTGLVDGILIGEGYTQCDITLAAFLQTDDKGVLTLDVPESLESGRLELSQERLSRLAQIRERQHQIGTEFMARYKDPHYLAEFLANGTKGWQNFNIKSELEAHLGQTITKASYEELLQSQAGMALPAFIGSYFTRTYQQIIQNTHPAFSFLSGNPLRQSFRKADMSSLNGNALGWEVMEHFSDSDIEALNHLYHYFCRPNSLFGSISGDLRAFVCGSGSDPAFFDTQKDFLRDLSTNIENGKPAQPNGGPSHLFASFGSEPRHRLQSAAEEQEYVEKQMPAYVFNHFVPAEEKARFRRMLLPSGEQNDAYIQEMLRKEQTPSAPESIWTMKRDDFNAAFQELEHLQRLPSIYEKALQFIESAKSPEDAAGGFSLTSEEKAVWSNRLKEQKSLSEDAAKALRTRTIQAKARDIWNRNVNSQKFPDTFSMTPAMSPAMRTALEGIRSREDTASQELSRLQESGQAAASLLNGDYRDMLWLVPLTEGMTNEQIRAAANETYHQYFSSDVRDRYRVLDRFFDAFDSFDVLSLDLSCLAEKKSPADASQPSDGRLSHSEEDVVRLLSFMNKTQSFVMKLRENPGYFEDRYPAGTTREIFDLKLETLIQMSTYVSGILYENGLDQNFNPISRSAVQPNLDANHPEIPLQIYRLSAAALTGTAAAPDIRFPLPTAEALYGGHLLLEGKTVSPQCQRAMADAFGIMRNSLLGSNPQKEKRDLLHISNTPMIMVDGVPAKEFFAQHLHKDTLSSRDVDALSMAAMLSGEHRVEGVLFFETPDGTLKPEIVPLKPDMSALDAQQIAGHNSLWRTFGGKTRGEKALQLWADDRKRAERHNQIREYVAKEAEKGSKKDDLRNMLKESEDGLLQRYDLNSLFESPEFTEYLALTDKMQEAFKKSEASLQEFRLQSLKRRQEIEDQMNSSLSLLDECGKYIGVSKDKIRERIQQEIDKGENADNQKLALYSRLYTEDPNAVYQDYAQKATHLAERHHEALLADREQENTLSEQARLAKENAWLEKIELEAEMRQVRRNLNIPSERDVLDNMVIPEKSEDIMKALQNIDYTLDRIRDTTDRLTQAERLHLYLNDMTEEPYLVRMELSRFMDLASPYLDSPYLTQDEKKALQDMSAFASRIIKEPEDAPIVHQPEDVFQGDLDELASTLRRSASQSILREYEELRRTNPSMQDLPKPKNLWDAYVSYHMQRETLMEAYVTNEELRLKTKLENRVEASKRRISYTELTQSQEQPAPERGAPGQTAPQKQNTGKAQKPLPSSNPPVKASAAVSGEPPVRTK